MTGRRPAMRRQTAQRPPRPPIVEPADGGCRRSPFPRPVPGPSRRLRLRRALRPAAAVHPGGYRRRHGHGRHGRPHRHRPRSVGHAPRGPPGRGGGGARLRHGPRHEQHPRPLRHGAPAGPGDHPAPGPPARRRAAPGPLRAVGVPALLQHRGPHQRVRRPGGGRTGRADHPGGHAHRVRGSRVRGPRHAGGIRHLRRHFDRPLRLRGRARRLRQQDAALPGPPGRLQGVQGPGAVRPGPGAGGRGRGAPPRPVPRPPGAHDRDLRLGGRVRAAGSRRGRGRRAPRRRGGGHDRPLRPGHRLRRHGAPDRDGTLR